MLKIVVPAYNCKEFIVRCLDSIATQDYLDYQVVVIDDASDDGTTQIIDEYTKRRGWMSILNEENKRCPWNLWIGVEALMPEPEDVIFLVDGDDFLPHGKVFNLLMEYYEDEELWLTYGQYEPYPKNTGQVPAKPYGEPEIRRRQFRGTGNFNHPITFRYKLWLGLDETDLQDENGEWYRGGYDCLLMWPMLEMATSPKTCHFKFLNEVLYMYNAMNPISDVYRSYDETMRSREVADRVKKQPLC